MTVTGIPRTHPGRIAVFITEMLGHFLGQRAFQDQCR
jgi:hypothetical protein